MAVAEFKHLESIPYDEENLLLGDDTEVNIKSKACINLGFVTLNSLNRLNSLNEINSRKIIEEEDVNKYSIVVKLLEQFLINSLVYSNISDLQNTQLTEHYKRRCITVSNLKILPDINYCQNLMYSKFKPWSSMYGALGYFNLLAEDYEEYYTPSELVYYSSKELVEYSQKVSIENLSLTGDNNYRLLSNYYISLYKTLDKETIESDDELYSYSSTLITKIPLLSLSYRDLNFYSNWLPEVYNWYKEKKKQNSVTKITEPILNEERAFNTLIEVVEVILSNALDDLNFKNLGSKFIRQTINSNIFDVLDELTQKRRASTYIKIDKVFYTKEEELVNKFFEVISATTSNYKYREGSYLLLSSVAAPGGYCMLLNLIAANLLNRAYILAFKENEKAEELQNSKVYSRILRLIGLAAICYTKTNISHFVTNGLNLLSLFELDIKNIEINNLLDI